MCKKSFNQKNFIPEKSFNCCRCLWLFRSQLALRLREIMENLPSTPEETAEVQSWLELAGTCWWGKKPPKNVCFRGLFWLSVIFSNRFWNTCRTYPPGFQGQMKVFLAIPILKHIRVVAIASWVVNPKMTKIYTFKNRQGTKIAPVPQVPHNWKHVSWGHFSGIRRRPLHGFNLTYVASKLRVWRALY